MISSTCGTETRIRIPLHKTPPILADGVPAKDILQQKTLMIVREAIVVYEHGRPVGGGAIRRHSWEVKSLEETA